MPLVTTQPCKHAIWRWKMKPQGLKPEAGQRLFVNGK